MTNLPKTPARVPLTRRTFVKGTGAAVVASALSIARSAHAAGDDVLKVALIGCGGSRRRRGPRRPCRLPSPSGCGQWPTCFSDKLEATLKALCTGQDARYDREAHKGLAGKIAVPPERRFIGFDAYKQAIDCVDVAILTTAPPLPANPLRVRGAAGETRLHGETRRRRRGGNSSRAGGGRRGQAEEPEGRRRATAAPSCPVRGDRQTHPGRRRRRDRLSAGVLERHRLSCPPGTRAGNDRDSLPTPQPVSLHLDQRGQHRRAARAQPGRLQLDQGDSPGHGAGARGGVRSASGRCTAISSTTTTSSSPTRTAASCSASAATCRAAGARWPSSSWGPRARRT